VRFDTKLGQAGWLGFTLTLFNVQNPLLKWMHSLWVAYRACSLCVISTTLSLCAYTQNNIKTARFNKWNRVGCAIS
jgi:hypothetical protein